MLQKLGLKQVIRCFILAVFLVKSFGLQKSLVLQKLLSKLRLIQFTLLSTGIPFCLFNFCAFDEFGSVIDES